MNIYENIAFGLKIKKLPKDEIDKKVREMLKMVSLEGFEKDLLIHLVVVNNKELLLLGL